MTTDEKIISIINVLIKKDTEKKVNNLYITGYVDGLKMALKIIWDNDTEAINAMAKYYNERVKI